MILNVTSADYDAIQKLRTELCEVMGRPVSLTHTVHMLICNAAPAQDLAGTEAHHGPLTRRILIP